MNIKEGLFRVFELFRGNFGEDTKHPVRIADIYTKKDLVFVSLQFFYSNTFSKYELSRLMKDDRLLSQIPVAQLKLLFEMYFNQDSKKDLKRVASSQDGIFIYTDSDETFRSTEEVGSLVENDELLDSLEPRSAFLLGRFVGEHRLVQHEKPRLYAIGG